MICPYCKKEAIWCENKEVYGKNIGRSYMMYLCKPCDARVGCHNNTRQALGTMADKELREWRRTAHLHLDRLWKDGIFTRKKVYQILKDVFHKEVHIGESNIEMCKEIIKKLQRPLNKKLR